MTYRERRLAKAERLREWADKREARASGVFAEGEKYRGDHAFNTQPGHIPERARLIAREDRACASLQKAEAMEARADSIEWQAAAAIYDDDSDARERLDAKAEALEKARDAKKAVNKAFAAAVKRGADRATALAECVTIGLLTAAEATDVARTMALCRYDRPFQGYVFSNLGARIRDARQRAGRLAHEAVAGKPWRYLFAKYAGTCAVCDGPIKAGDAVLYRRPEIKHETCPRAEIAPAGVRPEQAG